MRPAAGGDRRAGSSAQERGRCGGHPARRCPPGAGVGQEHCDLAVPGAPGRTAALAPQAHGEVTLSWVSLAIRTASRSPRCSSTIRHAALVISHRRAQQAPPLVASAPRRAGQPRGATPATSTASESPAPHGTGAILAAGAMPVQRDTAQRPFKIKYGKNPSQLYFASFKGALRSQPASTAQGAEPSRARRHFLTSITRSS